MEYSRVLGGGSVDNIGLCHGNGMQEMGGNKGLFEATIEAVNIAH